MTDFFLDRLETQLVQAEQRLAPRRARRRWARKSIVIPAMIVATAVPALAATQPWNPTLGRPKLHDRPHGTSTTPVPTNVLSIFAVLRRPQTAADRGPLARKLLRNVGQQFYGVRPDSVRLVTLDPGHHLLVTSSRRVGPSPGVGPDLKDPLCMVLSATVSCTDYQRAVTQGVTLSGGSTLYGLVPDGVERVEFDFGTRGRKTAIVHDNGWILKDAPLVPDRGGTAPDGRPLPPSRTTAPVQTHWLDKDGHDIGPSPGP
jgi:hypothetical protein